LTAAAGASSPPGELQRHADAIHALGIVGVQARLVTGGGQHTVATSGVADVRTGRPVPPDGRFRVASTAKALSATVALQLVGEGRLRLDDTVERWLPGVVRGNGNDGRRITVRHLLPTGGAAWCSRSTACSAPRRTTSSASKGQPTRWSSGRCAGRAGELCLHR
jgi:D-alanyl-D-alanine carboxypeptidase